MQKQKRQAGIQNEQSVLEGRFRRDGIWVMLRCRFWESGSYPVTEDKRFDHPSPAFNRLFLFHRGSCEVKTPEGIFRLCAGQIHLLPISQSFSVTYKRGSLFDFFHIKVEDAFGRDVFEGLSGIHTLDASAKELFDEVLRCFARPEPYLVMRWQATLFQAVCRFCEAQWELTGPRLQKEQPLHTIISYVQENLHPDLSVEEMAAHSGMSRATLNRFFRKHLRMSVKEYVIALLIQQAKEHLSSGEESIKQVAVGLGYKDPFYFQRLFRQRTGLTPLQFRRQALTRPVE